MKIIVKTRTDLTGKRFGKLLVIKQDECDYVSPKNQHLPKWICQCDCGRTVSINAYSLQSSSRSCGCAKPDRKPRADKTAPRRNLIGMKFGKLLVVKQAPDYITTKNQHYTCWQCQCDCGNIINVYQSKLTSGHTTSCGCFRKQVTSKVKTKDICGKRFGKLVVLQKVKGKDTKSAWWLCQCDCGCVKIVRSSALISGDTKSCGCEISFGEHQIRQYLLTNEINFQPQYWFDDLRNNTTNSLLYFDFAIFKDNKLDCLIEYNGIQHYEDCGKFGLLQREKTDAIKQQYCHKNNITLHTIKYNDDVICELNKIFTNTIC